jgi:hypothetical protein
MPGMLADFLQATFPNANTLQLSGVSPTTQFYGASKACLPVLLAKMHVQNPVSTTLSEPQAACCPCQESVAKLVTAQHNSQVF